MLCAVEAGEGCTGAKLLVLAIFGCSQGHEEGTLSCRCACRQEHNVLDVALMTTDLVHHIVWTCYGFLRLKGDAAAGDPGDVIELYQCMGF